MAYEQNTQEPRAHFESDRDVSPKQEWKSVSAPTAASENVNGGFDCNICFDSAQDPVVTFCGHLYCWPCIYKWLQIQSSSESDEEPKCPVCKANISQSSLVPLYGRGTSTSESGVKRPQLDLVVPHRPTAHGLHPLVTAATSVTSHPNHHVHSYPFQPQRQSFHHQQYFPHPHGNYASMASSDFGGTAMARVFSPTVGMFGDMVLARMFGSSDASLFPYPYATTYPLTGNGSPRMRRQEMQVEKSLNRVCIFLCCCLMLCLLLF